MANSYSEYDPGFILVLHVDLKWIPGQARNDKMTILIAKPHQYTN